MILSSVNPIKKNNNSTDDTALNLTTEHLDHLSLSVIRLRFDPFFSQPHKKNNNSTDDTALNLTTELDTGEGSFMFSASMLVN